MRLTNNLERRTFKKKGFMRVQIILAVRDL